MKRRMATTEQAKAKIQQKGGGGFYYLIADTLARPGIGINVLGLYVPHRTDSTAHLYYILTKPHLLLYMKVRPGVVVAQRSFDSWLFSFAVDVDSHASSQLYSHCSSTRQEGPLTSDFCRVRGAVYCHNLCIYAICVFWHCLVVSVSE